MFAESLLTHLDLQSGLTVLDVNCGDGIPAFYLAHQVGSAGHVLAIDVSEAQLVRARTVHWAELGKVQQPNDEPEIKRAYL